MRRIFSFLILIPLAALLVLLALANRRTVLLSLDPFAPETSNYSIELPLFLVVLACIALGLIIGAVGDWIGQGHYRREARERRHEVRRLEEEAAHLRAVQPASALPVPYASEGAR